MPHEATGRAAPVIVTHRVCAPVKSCPCERMEQIMTTRTFRGLVTFSVMLALTAVAQASPLILLEDDFNDNVIDTSKWDVVLSGIPQNPKSVTETGGRMRLQGRGHLNTVQQFDPVDPAVGGLRITGTWEFGSDDFLQILTRSDGTPAGGYGETANGIEMFAFTGNNQVSIRGRGGASVTGGGGVNLPNGIPNGGVFDFEFTDDGTNLSATLTQVGNPTNTATVTASSTSVMGTNLGVFHNRESGRVSYLDDVVIESLTLQTVPVDHEVGGDNFIGTETLTGTQSNEVFDPGVLGAKVIRINQNRNETIQIAEVLAIETGTGTNKALSSLGAVATATSSDYGTVPGDANDGSSAQTHNSGSVWHSDRNGNPGGHTNQELVITLANPTDLDAVTILGRSDCCHSRQDNFDLIIEDAGGLELFSQNVLGLGTSPGNQGTITLAQLTSADLTAHLNPHDFGAGYTYVFELGSADKIEVANPDPGVFTTYLDLNDADIVVELLGSATPAPGDVYDLLDADVIQGPYNSLTLPDLSASGLLLDDTNFLIDGTLEVVAVIPEPMTMLAVGMSLAGLGGYVRKRRRR